MDWDRIHLELEWLTRGVRAIRIAKFGETEMSRLDEKWARAGGVVQRVEQHIESRLDDLIAREDEVARKTHEVFERQNAPLADQMKALDALDRRLDLLSNGGPQGPLPGSGGSQDATVPPPVPVDDAKAPEIERKELAGASFPKR